ncbi:MAG: chemotaxis protein CheB [Anaerolineales bacterium]
MSDLSPQFPIVALCASAGGLTAFQNFFDAMPPRSGIAFVVIQHLARGQDSILDKRVHFHFFGKGFS